MVKAVTLTSSSIQQHFIRNFCTKFGISNPPQFPDIDQNLGISGFRISGQPLIKENCYNSRASQAIDMKRGLVTKIDKRNKMTSKKFDDDVMSANCDVIIIFLIYGQFGATQKPDSSRIVCKTYIFINSIILTSFRKGGGCNSPSPSNQTEPLKISIRIGLNPFETH